ncbi:hypothetical protein METBISCDRAFT_18709 [Metschnikowia bicuspidata]|uniref:Uncharacterized protein n=1 Tax=Metschnikowia bicuspidata TaxID=27322 RepID=A0A4P9Z9G6_9ASCO|nr:hypothetical protein METBISCDRAFT_18709 [Metschnikowia bicuspidata]
MSKTLLFLQLIRSPGHLSFVAANVTLLVHLQLLSTLRLLKHKEKHQLKISELQNFSDLVNNLDSQIAHIQSQISELKSRKKRLKQRDPMGYQDGLLSPQLMARRLREENYAKGQIRLARKFTKEREAFKALAKLPDILAKLFPESADTASNDTAQNHPRTVSRTYSSPLANSLLLLSSLLIQRFLVELNLRHAFQDKKLLDQYPQETYLIENGLSNSLSCAKRTKIQEVLASLTLHGVEITINDVLADLPRNESFTSVELKRQDFYTYKSAHWLNYAFSDVTSSIEACLPPAFLSSVVDDEEYFRKITGLFSAHKTDLHPFKHFNLALSVAKMLATGGERSPSILVIRVLLDKFGEHGLYSYQSSVHDALPSFGSGELEPLSERPDADAATTKLYLMLIQKDPQYLHSLIDYNFRKGKHGNVKFLLSFLEPSAATRKALSSHLLPFFHNNLRSTPNTEPHAPLWPGAKTYETALEVCAQIGDYDRMDRILVGLLSGAQTPSVLDSGVLLTPKMLANLGQTYLKRKDAAHLQWLAPFVEREAKRLSDKTMLVLAAQLRAMSPAPAKRPTRQMVPEILREPMDRAVSMVA